jgi:hypothetical protein
MTDIVYSLKTVSYPYMVCMTDTVYSLKTVSYLYMVCMTDTVYIPYKGKILS